MAYIPYGTTNGGYTVKQLVGNTVTSTFADGTKSTPVENINWREDYTLVSESPSEVVLTSTTGAGLTSPSKIKLAQKSVKDVFASSSLDCTCLPSMKKGQQIMISLEELYSAIGDIDQGEFPLVGWVCLRIPTHPAVTATCVANFVQKLIGTLMATDSTNSSSHLGRVLRQKLDPTR